MLAALLTKITPYLLVSQQCKRDELVKSQKLGDKVKSSRCKARESLGMRRTQGYVGLAELSQVMTKDEAQRSRWTFYEVVKIET